MRRFIILLIITGIAMYTNGQDPHSKGIEQMKLWYNPALQTDTTSEAHVLLNKVNYPGILSTTTRSITLALVFERNIETVSPTIPFITLAAGLNVDNASDNLMHASSAMMALSYALPLDYNSTWLSLGFQGNYSFNRVGYTGSYYNFPENFDQFGAFYWAHKRDPSMSGYNKGYFTFNAGTAVFHTLEEQQWFVGFSTRFINRPYTEWDHVSALPVTYGVQAGYTGTVNEHLQLSGYGNISWVTGSSTTLPEQYFGVRAIRKIDVNDSTAFHLSLGVGMSFKQALQPNLQLHWGRHLFEGYIDVNLPGIASSDYTRKGFTLMYRYDL